MNRKWSKFQNQILQKIKKDKEVRYFSYKQIPYPNPNPNPDPNPNPNPNR